MPDRRDRQVFNFAVARLHDQIDSGGRHVEKCVDDMYRPVWEQELDDFQDAAAIGPELDDPLTGFELQELMDHPEEDFDA